MKMHLIVQEIRNEPPSTPSTPRRNKKLRDLAQLHKEMVSVGILTKKADTPEIGKPHISAQASKNFCILFKAVALVF
jgi:hypothetical protein